MQPRVGEGKENRGLREGEDSHPTTLQTEEIGTKPSQVRAGVKELKKKKGKGGEGCMVF